MSMTVLSSMQTSKLSSKGAFSSSRPALLPQPRVTVRNSGAIVAMAKNPLKAPFKSKVHSPKRMRLRHISGGSQSLGFLVTQVKYDSNEPQVNPAQSAFTRRREVWFLCMPCAAVSSVERALCIGYADFRRTHSHDWILYLRPRRGL